MATTVITFRDQGTPKTGLSPTIDIFLKVADGQSAGTPPTVSELGGGAYKFTYTATEAVIARIDSEDTGMDDCDRYIYVLLTPEDELLDNLDAPISDAVSRIENVHYDAVYLASNGTTGTDYDKGTRHNPVNNVTDALAICSARGIRKLVILSSGSFSFSGQTLDGFAILGEATFAFVDFTGCTITNSYIENLFVTNSGSAISTVLLRKCVVTGSTWGADTTFFDCLFMDSVYFGGSVSLVNCTGGTTVYFSAPCTVNFRHFAGNVVVCNMTTNCYLQLDDVVGTVTLHGSCNGGTVTYSGTTEIIDQSAGVTITPTKAAINTDTVQAASATALNTYDPPTKAELDAAVSPLTSDLTLLKKIETGRWKIVNKQLIMYEQDGVTPLLTFDLKDSAGQPSDVYVYERVPV